MKEAQTDSALPEEKKPGSGCLRTLGIISIVVLVIILIGAGWVKYNIYASKLTPTELSKKEEKILDSKLALLTESDQSAANPAEFADDKPGVKPEKYSEKGARREVSLTEKELNFMVAKEPDVAERVAIDLSDGMVSVKLVLPVDDDVILLGGKTLRLNLGILLGYENNRPVVGIKGVSIGGIPLPNAWLGYLKEKNLVEEFGTEDGFWKLFAAGIKDISVKDGHILIQLHE